MWYYFPSLSRENGNGKIKLHERENRISLTAHLHPEARLRISSSTSRPLSRPPKKTHLTLIHFPYGFTKSHSLISTTPTGFPTLAKNDNKDPNEIEENDYKSRELGSDGGDGSGKKNGRSIFNSIRWGELLMNPDPDNILAVGLTGLLTWASV
ncbi:hypothetical protein TIFTF001_021877 [Ficus carica]|uniref:Uncharacterized protein n=1 Tax=Ficus carica TaxID=3494 RepID=A0AA88AV92_FICCA|nr:hypothetical protein TIFTF001_021877 [Ficus carica]